MKEKKVIRRARRGRPIRQVAAIPFRQTEGAGMDVMLITSRGTQRFTVPKGWPMKGISDRKAAGIEASQEAGVSGPVLKKPIGRYRYWKRLSEVFVPVDVTVYLLAVSEVLPDWREAGERQRAWLRPADAATIVDEPQLASLLRSLSRIEEAREPERKPSHE